MFRRIAVLSILASAAVSSTALADFFFEVQETTVAVPASGTTDFLVPVHLVSDAPGTDLPKTIRDYQVVFNVGTTDPSALGGISSIAGLSFDAPGAVEVFPIQIFGPPKLIGDIGFADIAISGEADTVLPAASVASPVHLFNLTFSVAAGTAPGTVPIVLRSRVLTNDPLQTIMFEGEAMQRELTLSPASGNIILTAVPEPSEWILGFLMTGLLGTIASKKLFAKKQVAENK